MLGKEGIDSKWLLENLGTKYFDDHHDPIMKATIKNTTLSTLEMMASLDGELTGVVDKNVFLILKQLGKSGYIYGKLGPQTMGGPETEVEKAGLTTEGRLLMERLISEREDRSISARVWRFGWPVACALFGGVFGIIAPLLTEYIKNRLGL